MVARNGSEGRGGDGERPRVGQVLKVVFPNRIREARREAGKSVAALARAIGVGEPHIYKVETGERPLTPEQLTRVAEVLGVSEASLVDPAALGEEWRAHEAKVNRQMVESGATATAAVLRDLRQQYQKTMRQVAEAAELSITIYFRLENATRLLAIAERDRIARFYGIDPQDVQRRIEAAAADHIKRFNAGTSVESLLPAVKRPTVSVAAAQGFVEDNVVRRTLRPVASPGRAPAGSEGLPRPGNVVPHQRPGVGRGARLPVFGRAESGRFVLDLNAATGSTEENLPVGEGMVVIAVHSRRLSLVCRPGSLVVAERWAEPDAGDVVVLRRTDGSAEVGVVLHTGFEMALHLYSPNEVLSLGDPSIDEILVVRTIHFPRKVSFVRR